MMKVIRRYILLLKMAILLLSNFYCKNAQNHKRFFRIKSKADEGKYLQLALSTNVYGDTAMHSGFILIIF